jgi:hypothetical protein
MKYRNNTKFAFVGNTVTRIEDARYEKLKVDGLLSTVIHLCFVYAYTGVQLKVGLF